MCEKKGFAVDAFGLTFERSKVSGFVSFFPPFPVRYRVENAHVVNDMSFEPEQVKENNESKSQKTKMDRNQTQKAKMKGNRGAKGQNERNCASQGPKGQNEEKWPRRGRVTAKPLGLGCLPLTGNAVATGHDAKAWRQRPSFTWAFTCVFFSRSRSSGRFGL